MVMILISCSQAYEFTDRNTSPKPCKKPPHFNPDLSLTKADVTAHAFVTKPTPISGTFLPSKTHVKKQIIPTRKLTDFSTNPPSPTQLYSATATKLKEEKSPKTSRTILGYLPKRKSTINDLAFAKNLSRNLRENAPSPEPSLPPSPPLGTREKGARG